MYVDMRSIADWTTREARTELLVLFGAVCCVLLIACANVANLLLSRAVARRREFAVRTALGASRARIIRQLIVEAAVLAIPAALVGALLAEWGVRLLGVFIPRWALVDAVRVDGRVLAFALGASLLAAFGAALWPAVQASGVAPSPTLREESIASGSSSRSRFRTAMVVTQVATSFVLLAGAMLLTKSFLRLVSTDTGFRPDRLVSMTLQLSRSLYPTPAARIAFRADLEQRLRALPGIDGVAITTGVPIAGTGMLTEFSSATDTSKAVFGPAVHSTNQLFGVLGVPIVAGRNFERGDSGVVILNRAAASKLFPGVDPVGQRVRMFDRSETVIGIVGDMRFESRAEPPRPQLFAPIDREPVDYLLAVVRTTRAPAAVMTAMRGVVRAIDARQPVGQLATLDQLLSDSVKQPRTQTLLLVTFGSLAFLMACLGLYGVVSFSVVQRTREIGVRVALGAERAPVMMLVLRQGLVLALLGASIGFVAALWATRFIAASLYEVKPLDASVLALTAAALLGVAIVASYLPARRATRIDPMIALRAE
jgi:putative ABC transport system permease protein